jgi:transaldolase / glucose-6-phosphate isomerase
MTTPIHQLFRLGQSLWYDNIQRRLLENGGLADMITRGYIRGVTSNPTIFHNAIAKTNDYDPALIPLAWSGWDSERIFWQLAIEDIRDACDLFSPLYRQSEGADGYVSLEVSPLLAHNTEATLAQAKQLWEWVDRPNLMVKIPATPEGVPAVRAAIAAGLNVNVTLIFSLERYRLVMEAFLGGLDDRLAAGLPVRQIASVASFFVSRMDTKVDAMLDGIGSDAAHQLRGQAAIAYTKLAYHEFLQFFRGPRFAHLKDAGCRPQRPLWASTSTKNPAYADTLYVDSLVAPGSVNTVPPQTLEAFRDHGKAAVTIEDDLDGARASLAALEALGISMDTVTAELETEGVKSFADAFTALLMTLEERRSTAVTALGPLAAAVSRRLSALVAEDAPARLWSHDATLWTTDPDGQTEVRKRLGWLDLPRTSRTAVKEINDFTASVLADGLTRVLLLGMGGSSLGPEVMSLIFPSPAQGKGVEAFAILDSTDPAQVLEAARLFPPERTLYLVSSKSGGTSEINAAFNFFWKLSGENGRHFAAITDPGTSLEMLANARGFRKTFHADPSVGGRYSALTHFGLVPAGLMGVDLGRLLDRAAWMMRQCAANVTGARNPGLVLGAIMGEAAVSGRDKMTFLADASIAPLGAWLEQLIAESTGKLGKGILPVDGEEPLNAYGNDRLFVYLRREGALDGQVEKLLAAGHPALVFNIPDAYDLGAEFYRWELATAFACVVLGVNAFDQPDVQDAKDRTKAKIAEYAQNKHFDEGTSLWDQDGLQAWSTLPLPGTSLEADLQKFLEMSNSHDYIAINAYLPRNDEMNATLQELRTMIGRRTGCATTLGFGPRFLHSTGQLHKGGPGSCLFLQITSDPSTNAEIPTQDMTFGTLERAQALGDYEALAARGRGILRLNLASPEALKGLVERIGEKIPGS